MNPIPHLSVRQLKAAMNGQKNLDFYITLAYLFNVHFIKVILNKLYSGIIICCVELVRYVPTQGAKLSPLLHNTVQEGHRIQHWLPLRKVH